MTGEQFIQRYFPRCLFHFTDRRNLNAITNRGGLLSLSILNDRRLTIPAPGGNEWSHSADKRSGLDKYVHLCFLAEHPMEFCARQDGRIGQSVFLEIDFRVLLLKGIRFTKEVSNRRESKLLTLDQAVKEMDFAIVYGCRGRGIPDVKNRLEVAKRYELLVPCQVPLDMITMPELKDDDETHGGLNLPF